MPPKNRPSHPESSPLPPPEGPARRDTPEAKLDALLKRYNARQAARAGHAFANSDDPVDQLRERFRHEFIPIFQEVADKYGPHGIDIYLDVEQFFAGGNEIIIDIAFERVGVRLLGTVLSRRIAFHEMRYANNIGPAVASGPTLRTRTLTPKQFREFLCERITELVRAVLHQQRSNPQQTRK
jgi:hypothetical protein